MEEVTRAVELAPKSALAWLSKGVGNYYLPATFGGGTDKAIADLEKAVELDPNSADAHLWLGIALRKAGRNAEARKAIERSLALNPDRKWARQQLDKTPVK
jgi:tetratricopeptide (TPR) repeat protein